MNFLVPDLFNNSELFDAWFEQKEISDQASEAKIKRAEKKNLAMIQKLHKILTPFMLRRTKTVVLKELPPKKQVHLFVGLTETQLGIYKNMLLNKTE